MEIFYIILGAVLIAALVYVFFSKAVSLTVVVAAAAVALLLPLPVYGITTAIAKNEQETFYEFWNGSEVSVDSNSRTCVKNGICTHTYQCDPRQVTETVYYTDSDGKRQSRQETKTEWDDCPYSKEETSYTIATTLGNFSAGSNLMTGEPYRWGVGIPGGQVTSPPQLWTDAKKRIEKGNPSGVTQINRYKNYILASDYTLFKEYSEEIENLKNAGYLQPPTKDVYDLYQASKVHAYGVNIPETYVKDLQNLNAKFGSDLHGDLHIVFVPASKVGDKTNYTNALKAYWTSPEMGDYAIAKNTVTVVVGVTSSTAEWATMFTGMPVGNEALIASTNSELSGATLDESFIGNPKFDIKKGTYSATDGKVENLLFGDNKFVRVSMSGDSEDDEGSGFSYLSEAWIPDEGTMTLVHILSIILVLLAMAGGAVLAYNYKDFDPVGNFLHTKGK